MTTLGEIPLSIICENKFHAPITSPFLHKLSMISNGLVMVTSLITLRPSLTLLRFGNMRYLGIFSERRT